MHPEVVSDTLHRLLDKEREDNTALRQDNARLRADNKRLQAALQFNPLYREALRRPEEKP